MQQANLLDEKMPPEVFTDRAEELACLHEFAGRVARGGAPSEALLGPRRVGKSAILRRFCNQLFWEQDEVAPFYFEMPEEPIWLHELACQYFEAFARQHLAFILKKPELARDRVRLDGLKPFLGSEDAGELREVVRSFEAQRQESAEVLFHFVRAMPRDVARWSDRSCIVVLDEFQRLDQVVYRDEALTRPTGRISGGYSELSESPDAPMLVAGSQVSMLAKHTLNHGLTGRFSRQRIGPLSLEAGAELTRRLSHSLGLGLSKEVCQEISRTAQGHPFYIRCAVESRAPGKNLDTATGIAEVFDYEIRRGKIFEFWDEHFKENLDTLDMPKAAEAIFFLLKWEQETPPEQKRRVGGMRDVSAAEALGLPEEKVEQLYRALDRVDLVEESHSVSFYRGIQDPMLARCLRWGYAEKILKVTDEQMGRQLAQELQTQLEEAEQEIRRLRGRVNEMLGRDAERTVQRLMKACFLDQRVSASQFFHGEDELLLPTFADVKPDRVVLADREEYQLDNVGKPYSPSAPWWVTEQKNWSEPVGPDVIEKFVRSARAWQKERGIEDIVLWVYGRSGFTDAALAAMRSESILHSDQNDLQELAAELGLADL